LKNEDNLIQSLFGGVFKMAYSHKNSRGVTYYLHTRGGKLFFFSKDPANGIDLPSHLQVMENPRTGLPMVKKK
jgi:hypothetical protein